MTYFEYRTLWLPKDMSDPDRYQDAFRVDPARGIGVVADGVSSSLFAANWAAILAEAVVQAPPYVDSPEYLGDWLRQLRDCWTGSFDADSLAWHQKPKLAEGAASTLLWVQVAPGDAGQAGSLPAGAFSFTCFSIGDCCLFHVRQGRTLLSFPMQNSAAFDADPQVLRSVASRKSVSFERLDDVCLPGDWLVLCSDAIGQWALGRLENGRSPDWEQFWDMTSEQWTQAVIRWRDESQIRFDDTTIVLLKIGRQPVVQIDPQEEEDRRRRRREANLGEQLRDLKDDLKEEWNRWIPKSWRK